MRSDTYDPARHASRDTVPIGIRLASVQNHGFSLFSHLLEESRVMKKSLFSVGLATVLACAGYTGSVFAESAQFTIKAQAVTYVSPTPNLGFAIAKRTTGSRDDDTFVISGGTPANCGGCHGSDKEGKALSKGGTRGMLAVGSGTWLPFSLDRTVISGKVRT